MLVDAGGFRDYFELLIGAYEEHPAGRLLVEWFSEDWSLFSPDLDIARAKVLLAEILDDGEIVRRTFRPRDMGGGDALAKWQVFRRELMHENRFFPHSALDQARLANLLSMLLLSPDEVPQRWFRARLNSSAAGYAAAEMGAPPQERASHGRANPAGIPYLYLASNSVTAVSELRPHTGESATVADISLAREINLVDLGEPRRTVSPFLLSDSSQIAMLRGDIGFLEQLGHELTRPVLPNLAAIHYLPSQYVCEFIKKSGYDGVSYRSSVGDGVNVALFNPQLGKVDAVRVLTVRRVSVELAI